MTKFVSIKTFLQGTKKAFLSAVQKDQPVRIVVGNESADLDSFASSILYAYFSSHLTCPAIDSPPTLPLLNIPRSDLALRPEHTYLTKQLSLTPADIFTLSELPDNLNPALTYISLVDHNVLQPPLSKTFKRSVVISVVDHHDDEYQYASADPRIIEPCGSCTSLVMRHFSTNFPHQYHNFITPVGPEIARLALAPILIDTANLTSKVTDEDIIQVTELMQLAEEGFSQDGYYEELQAAKSDVSEFSIEDLLRKDYKQWKEPNGLLMGVSAIIKCLAWVVDHAGGMKAFTEELAKWAEKKGLDTVIVMTTDNSKGFRRDLLIWGCTDRTKGFAEEFGEKGKEKFALDKWPGKEDEVDEEFGVKGMKAWTQAELELSRKQVAPFLRDIASKL